MHLSSFVLGADHPRSVEALGTNRRVRRTPARDFRPAAAGCRAALCAALLCICCVHADEVDELVTEEMRRQHIPGVSIAIVQKGKIVKEQGYGIANVEHDVPVTPKTVFQSASIGKQFTAALTMLLVEDGSIKLDEPISTYLPEAPDSWSQITVRHLLTHTSGLRHMDESINFRRDYSEKELLESMAKLPLLFTPGEKWSYSGLGYQVLGFLCHRIGGKFYGDQLHDRIFKPLGMTATVISERNIVPHRAAGYERVDGVLVNQEWVAPTLNTTADGSLYVSAHDLALWSIALDGDKVLSQTIKDVMFTPAKLNNGGTTDYGFGWFVGSGKGHRFAAHRGIWQGFTTSIIRILDDKVTVIVLANRSRAQPWFIAQSILGRFIPELSIAAPTAETFSSVVMLLRGSMNKLGVPDQLQKSGEGFYITEVDIEPGEHTFRIVSKEWATLDLGAPFDDPAVEVGKAKRLESRGEDMIVHVLQRGRYVFRLDVREPRSPILTVHPVRTK